MTAVRRRVDDIDAPAEAVCSARVLQNWRLLHCFPWKAGQDTMRGVAKRNPTATRHRHTPRISHTQKHERWREGDTTQRIIPRRTPRSHYSFILAVYWSKLLTVITEEHWWLRRIQSSPRCLFSWHNPRDLLSMLRWASCSTIDPHVDACSAWTSTTQTTPPNLTSYDSINTEPQHNKHAHVLHLV